MSHHFHMSVEHSLQNTHIQWLSKSLRVTCKGVTVALLEAVHITVTVTVTVTITLVTIYMLMQYVVPSS